MSYVITCKDLAKEVRLAARDIRKRAKQNGQSAKFGEWRLIVDSLCLTVGLDYELFDNRDGSCIGRAQFNIAV